MNNKRENQANIYVRDNMFNALLRLVKDKPISVISISELTKEAKVSRISFYRNYESVEQIFEDRLNQLVDEYKKEDFSKQGRHYCDVEFMVHCFSCFKKNNSFISGLINCGMGELFLNTIEDYLCDKWIVENSSKEDKYMIKAFAGAIYALYMSWYLDGFKEEPEEIAKMFSSHVKK